MVLVKAQATKQKGIAMRLFLTILSALLLSATVTTAEEIRAECTVLYAYAVEGEDAVVKHYPSDIGKSSFIQFDERKLLYRFEDYVEEYKFTKKDFDSKTFIRSIGVGASMEMHNFGTHVITLKNWDCGNTTEQRILSHFAMIGAALIVDAASCPCAD